MDAVTLLNVVLAVVNVAIAVFQGWREWHSHRAHPLEGVLRDVAQAIRELGPR